MVPPLQRRVFPLRPTYDHPSPFRRNITTRDASPRTTTYMTVSPPAVSFSISNINPSNSNSMSGVGLVNGVKVSRELRTD
jgi:hypothetical protein